MSIPYSPSRVMPVIAFIDTAIDNYDHLVNGIAQGIDVIAIPHNHNGVQYITEYLTLHPGYSRVYIVAHGESGALSLGSATLSLETIEQYSWDLQSWFPPTAHLTSSALVLYSCNVASGDRGTAFLHQLRHLCGVAIAASSTPVGNPIQGGTWDLDQRTDAMNVVVPFRPQMMQTYAGVLGTIQGRTWHDANENGIQDEGEEAIAGLQVTLSGSIYGEVKTLTAEDGTYEFHGLRQGGYGLQFGDREHLSTYGEEPFFFTQVDQGNDERRDSDVSYEYGDVWVELDDSHQTLSHIDAGLVLPSSISGQVWQDLNFNGVRDAREAGLGGVLVALEGQRQDDTLFTITNDDGSYEFQSIWPGDYSQVIVDPNLAAATLIGEPDRFTIHDEGNNDRRDSDVDADGRMGISQSEPGEAIAPIDAGMLGFPTVEGRVWDDVDGNGFQGEDEPGVGGVTVTLIEEWGDRFITTTNSDGTYRFENVDVGSAQIQIGPDYDPNSPTSPNESPFTYSDFSTPENEDRNSDVNDLGQAYVPLYPDDEFYPRDGRVIIDAGLVAPLPMNDEARSISGYLWQDSDNNGIYDDTEAPQAGVTVRLMANYGNTVLATAITNDEGFYQFTELEAQQYDVWIDLESLGSNAEISSPQEPGSPESAFDYGDRTTVDLFQSSMTDLNAGILLPPSVSGRVWHDANGNGVQDEGEVSLSGVLVELSGWSDSVQQPVTYRMLTNTLGEYAFNDLEWGRYDISVQSNAVLPEVEFTIADAVIDDENGSLQDDTLDSDFDEYSGATSIDLYPEASFLNQTEVNSSNLRLDAGLLLPPKVSGRVWHDLNQNGLQDSHEPGIAGVRVELDQRTIYTNAEGQYEFRNLAPGNYDLFIDIEGISPTAQFTRPHVLPDEFIDPLHYEDDHDRDSDMGSDRLSIDLYRGEQIDLDAGIVGYLGPVYPEFYFSMPINAQEETVVSPILDPMNQERFVTYSIDWGDESDPTLFEQDKLFYGDNSPWPEHVYEQGGSYTVTVTAVDEQGDRVTQREQIYVEAIAPDIMLNLPPQILEDTEVQPEIQIYGDEAIAYVIDWGDDSDPVFVEGGVDVASVPGHTYATAGEYTVTVTALDDDGDLGTARQDITVQAMVPEFSVQMATTGQEHEPFIVMVHGLEPNDASQYSINWGDGSDIEVFENTNAPQIAIPPQHLYTKPGEYTVTVTAVAQNGDEVTQSQDLTMSALLPSFDLAVADADTETFVTLDIEPLSLEPDVLYEVDWGDGSITELWGETDEAPDHQYAQAGRYTLVITATDADLDEFLQTQTVVIEAIAAPEPEPEPTPEPEPAPNPEPTPEPGPEPEPNPEPVPTPEPNPSPAPTPPSEDQDTDGDGVPDTLDNAPNIVNPEQNETTQVFSNEISVDEQASVPLPVIDFTSGDKGVTETGSTSKDRIKGEADNDTLRGNAGNDKLSGKDGNDRLLGGGDNDVLNGGKGNDRLLGQTGKDKLVGGGGHDYLDGGTDNDNLKGGGGNDILWGGKGDDLLHGGGGKDVFLFKRINEGSDRIKKFEAKRDRIDLSTLLRKANLSADAIVLMQQDQHTELHIQGKGLGNGSNSVLLATLENTTMETIQPKHFIL